MACDFSEELSNGMKAGIVGLIIGALSWFMVGEKKHGVRGYDKPEPKPAPKSEEKR